MSFSDNSPKPAITKIDDGKKNPKEISEEEWRRVLSPSQFEITRKAGTEAPFSGKYDKHFVAGGKYNCICCGAELFLSESKFNSGCGWPAFSKSIEGDKNIIRLPDHSHGRIRTEVRCMNCNAHLGHVFDDGPPKDGGERYCINSESMNFNPGTGGNP